MSLNYFYCIFIELPGVERTVLKSKGLTKLLLLLSSSSFEESDSFQENMEHAQKCGTTCGNRLEKWICCDGIQQKSKEKNGKGGWLISSVNNNATIAHLSRWHPEQFSLFRDQWREVICQECWWALYRVQYHEKLLLWQNGQSKSIMVGHFWNCIAITTGVLLWCVQCKTQAF